MKVDRASETMTDKQILAESRPRLLTYTNSYGKRQARPCLLCGSIIQGTFLDLENHVRDMEMPVYEEQYTRPKIAD